jgi:hypothetical protein
MALNICSSGLPKRLYKVKSVKIARKKTRTGAPHISSQMFRTPEYSENAQYKMAAAPPINSEMIPKKKNANGKKRRPRRCLWKGGNLLGG